MAICSLFLYEALQAFQDASAQKRQAAQDLAQVVTRTAQQGIHGITLGSLEEVPCQASIRFHVPNHRLHRIAALELLLDGYGNPSLGARNPYLESIQGDAMTAIAPIHVRFPEYRAGQPLGLRQ